MGNIEISRKLAEYGKEVKALENSIASRTTGLQTDIARLAELKALINADADCDAASETQIQSVIDTGKTNVSTALGL